MFARILTILFASSAFLAHAQSVAVSLNFSGTSTPGLGVAVFSGTGTISPFGPANITITVDASPNAQAGAPALVSIEIGNIGAGGAFVNSSLPVLEAHTRTPAHILSSTVISGAAVFDSGTYQFQSSDGPLQFTLSLPDLESDTFMFTFTGSGTVTSPILQTIIKQAGLAPSVRAAFSQLNGQPPIPPEKFVIGLWNGTQSVQYSTSTTTTSGGSWLTASPATGTVPPLGTPSVTGTVDPNGLGPGVYQGTVNVSGTTSTTPSPSPGSNFLPHDSTNFSTDVPVTLVINASDRLILSQTGLQFRSGLGVTPATQTITVSTSGATQLSFTATASTSTNGKWLSVDTPAGSASMTSPASINVQVDPTALAPGTYYGTLAFAAQGAGNTPQIVQVVLTVLQANASTPPIFAPAGLHLIATPGNLMPAGTFQILNPTGQTMTLSSQAFSEEGDNRFSITSSAAKATASQPVTVSVKANAGGVSAGSHVGYVRVSVAETGATYRIPVILVFVPATFAACTPTHLLPIFTSLPSGFQTPTALPVPLTVQIIDDCGATFDSGQVTLAFPSTDSPAAMTPFGKGAWSATWFPHGTADGTASVQVAANSLTSSLQGAASIQGTLSANKTAPLVNAGGVVSNASFASGAPLSPGAFVAIFGSNLASSTALAGSLPFLTNMGGAQVFLGTEALPLQYAANGQINAIIPYDVPVNATQQLMVEQGGADSMPETILLAKAQPAVFTVDQSGKGAGAITVVKPDGSQFQASPATPASAGDVLEIFCSGLGAVTPEVVAGAAAPSTPPAETADPLTASLAGQPVQVAFAGLAPGFAGLYQVNVKVPSGISGDTIPVILTVAGASSPPVTVAIH